MTMPEPQKPIPCVYRRVESGHSSPSPPLRVQTRTLSQAECLENIDRSKDAIVVFLNNAEVQAYNELMGTRTMGAVDLNPHRGYCLHVPCARALCIDLLYHLASCGEEMALKIVERLPDLIAEIEAEKEADRWKTGGEDDQSV